jgi:hypothetical protein
MKLQYVLLHKTKVQQPTTPERKDTTAQNHAGRFGNEPSNEDSIMKQTKERGAGKPCGRQTASAGEVPTVRRQAFLGRVCRRNCPSKQAQEQLKAEADSEQAVSDGLARSCKANVLLRNRRCQRNPWDSRQERNSRPGMFSIWQCTAIGSQTSAIRMERLFFRNGTQLLMAGKQKSSNSILRNQPN